MKLKEIWVFRHPSGELQEFEVAYVNVRGADMLRRNSDTGGTQWWSEMFIQRETEKGNLYRKPEVNDELLGVPSVNQSNFTGE